MILKGDIKQFKKNNLLIIFLKEHINLLVIRYNSIIT